MNGRVTGLHVYLKECVLGRIASSKGVWWKERKDYWRHAN
jgi:hypothetical protein